MANDTDIFKDVGSGSRDSDIFKDLPSQEAEKPAPVAKESLSWKQVPMQAISNLPSSAANFAGGLYNAIRHPIDTGTTLLDAAAGGLRNILPSSVSSAIDRADWNPEAAQRASGVASAVKDVYKDRYGSAEGLKNTLATDPVGVAGDLSAVLGGFAGLMPKGAATTNAVALASKYTNPLTPVLAAGRGALNLAGNAAAQGLGLTTGVGAENVKTAYRSGAQGNTDFTANMAGKVPMTQVIDDAKAAVSNMKAQRSAAYRSGMVDVSKDATKLDFTNIDNAISEANKVGTFNGQVINPAAAGKVGEMSRIVEEWLRLPPERFHTPEGMDALKQRLGAVLETIPYEQGQARLAAGKIYNAAKQTIVDQAPTYAKVMKDYSEASDLINEVQKAFSLNDRATADTALRKLQSLTRNNVNTNYGNRLNLASQLEQQGGKSLMPALSGQAMNSWTPRGIQGMALIAEITAAITTGNLLPLALLPASSPRLVGNAAYGLGAVGRMIPGVPDAALMPALLMQRAGALQQP